MLDWIGGDRLVDFIWDIEWALFKKPLCWIFGHKPTQLDDGLKLPICRRCCRMLTPKNVIPFKEKK